jgi:hypothetical protein
VKDMKTPQLKQFFLSASCLLCAGVALAGSVDLLGSEEGGGSVTGPIVKANVAGGGLLIAALCLAYFRPKVAAAGAFLAALLCLPLYLFTVEPKAFLQMFPGPALGAYQDGFIANGWAIAGLATALMTICLSLWNMTSKP